MAAVGRREVAVGAVAGLLAGCSRTGGSRDGGSGDGGARPLGERGEGVALPAPDTVGHVPLEQVLLRRRSVRAFAPTPLTRAELGQLLWAAQGVTHDGGRRTAPSAGARYPLEIYAVTATTALHYRPDGHRVHERVVPDAIAGLAAATPSADAVRGAPAVVVVTGVDARTAAKYGGRARAYVDLEAGHAAENLVLQAVALGLGAVTIGALDAGPVVSVLGLPVGEHPRYLIPVGHPRA